MPRMSIRPGIGNFTTKGSKEDIQIDGKALRIPGSTYSPSYSRIKNSDPVEHLPFMAVFAATLLLFLLLISATAISEQYERLDSFAIHNSPWRVDQKRMLVSEDGAFAAGFRSLPTSSHLFLFAVWYQNATDKTIIWAGNRDAPVTNSSSLVFSQDGKLMLGLTTLIGPAAGPSPNSTKLLLQNTGCLRFGNWASFDHPTDTILPNPTLPLNATNLVARMSPTDYRSGPYSLVNSTSLLFEKEPYETTGKGALTSLTSDGFLKGQTGGYVLADVGASNRLRRLTLDSDGNLRVYSLNPDTGNWSVVWRLIPNICKVPGLCGLNSICMSDVDDHVSCVCPPGFRRTNGSSCEPIINISTDPAETRFLQLDFVNFTRDFNANRTQTLTLSSCESSCLDQPSCRGFVYQFDGSRSCAQVHHQLDYGRWSPGTLTAAFIRVSKRENATTNFTGLTELVNTTCPVRLQLPEAPDMSNPRTRNLAIVCCFFALELLGGMAFFWAFLRRHTHYRESAGTLGLDQLPLRRFTLTELRAATDDFSHEIGSGGFGTVYKGELPDHRVVAVKRLKFSSRCSSDAEFWAEAAIIARLHHLNLVRLWGFCAEKGQRLLVYEYVPNGSLSKYLFPAAEEGVAEAQMVDWSIRYRIAIGVARAIAYLHEECREWVLHCDIKPENILLENDFCPKVSDFGLAKLATKADMVSMSGIRGTRGYLAPEWVERNQTITAKADVYSFGMVLLEIVCGIRNMEFQQSSMESCEWYLPKWAYEKVCIEKKVEDIIDPRLLQAYDCHQHFKMVDRMVKTAIWCLQDRPEMRPSMGKVAKMLEGTVDIVDPPQATIFFLGPSPSPSPVPGQKNSAPKTAEA